MSPITLLHSVVPPGGYGPMHETGLPLLLLDELPLQTPPLDDDDAVLLLPLADPPAPPEPLLDELEAAPPEPLLEALVLETLEAAPPEPLLEALEAAPPVPLLVALEAAPPELLLEALEAAPPEPLLEELDAAPPVPPPEGEEHPASSPVTTATANLPPWGCSNVMKPPL